MRYDTVGTELDEECDAVGPVDEKVVCGKEMDWRWMELRSRTRLYSSLAHRLVSLHVVSWRFNLSLLAI
jgi:hypothetical protein